MTTREVTQIEPLLEVRNLRVAFGRNRSERGVVRGISFSVDAGRCLAIVGESGSGKSVTARSLLGLAGRGSRTKADRISLGGASLLGLSDRQWRQIRGRQIGFVLQDALVSLDQLRRVGQEIAEPLRLHRWGSRTERERKVIELLTLVGVPEPKMRARQRPHELSGGLRQRALLASAIALDPRLIIADEPTTALDVTIQAQILDLLGETKARGNALILISHDLAVVAQLADDVVVMRDGEIVERGPARRVLSDPQHEYTRALLDAVPAAHAKGTRLAPTIQPIDHVQRISAKGSSDSSPIIEARGLVKRYLGPDGVLRTVLDDVSFDLRSGETLGVVGESGSGKTTAARIVLALVEPDRGEVLLDGQPWTGTSEKDRRPRRRRMTTVYQDPLSSFDPRWPVIRIVEDGLSQQTYPSAKERKKRVVELLHQAGLGEELFDRRPLQLSGGQRQRVAIARALAPEPAVVICDEPVSALDVSIQAQVLDLLADLQDELGLAYLFISHDLGVIHHVSDRVMVMKDGKVVEYGEATELFEHPHHPYTQRLLTAVPTLDHGDRMASVG